MDYPYIIIFLVIFFFSIKYWKRSNQKYLKIVAWLSFLFIGLRAPVVGADTYDYVRIFLGKSSNYEFSIDNWEPLFVAYNYILGLFIRNGQLYLLISTFISLFPIFYLVKRYSCNPPLSILLFFLLGIYQVYFVALRQILGLAILLCGVIYVLEEKQKKWFVFILLSVCSYMIHRSSVIAAIVFLLCYFIPLSRKWAFLFIMGSCFCGLLLNWVDVTKILFLASGMQLDFIHADVYLQWSLKDTTGYFGILIKTLVALYVFRYVTQNRVNHWFLKIYLVNIVLMNIFHSVQMFSRFNLPFSVFSIIVFTWVFGQQNEITVRTKKIINSIAFILLFLLSVSYIRSNTFYDLKNASRMHPYLLFFEDYSQHPSIVYWF